MGVPNDLDPVAAYEELAAPLRRARTALQALPRCNDWTLYDFAQARADEHAHAVSPDDAIAYRERFVREAAALFAGADQYGVSGDVPRVYDDYVLGPMREVRTLLEQKLADSTVPEKLAFHKQVSQRYEDFPDESPIIVAMNLMIASMIPGSDMNY